MNTSIPNIKIEALRAELARLRPIAEAAIAMVRADRAIEQMEGGPEEIIDRDPELLRQYHTLESASDRAWIDLKRAVDQAGDLPDAVRLAAILWSRLQSIRSGAQTRIEKPCATCRVAQYVENQFDAAVAEAGGVEKIEEITKGITI